MDPPTHRDLCTFLRFAIRCTDCLEFIHRNGVVHGEIKISSFRLGDVDANYDGGEGHRAVKLWNFGSGSRSPATSLTSDGWRKSANDKEMLVYMSPEQTGRTMFAPDHRSDIYSLGIVFFILLTGKLPFNGSQLDILASVLSRKIAPVCEWQPNSIPHVLSRIIGKMICKSPDDRYTSAHGVGYDLKECLERILARSNPEDGSRWMIPDFTLAQHDVASVFTLPKAVYGREKIILDMTDVIEHFVREYNSHEKRTKVIQQRAFSDKTNPGLSSQLQQTTTPPFGVGVTDAISLTYPKRSDRSRSQTGSMDQNEQPVLRTQKLSVMPIIVAIYGPGGIGKSTLFASVQPIARQNGYIAAAKFDSRTKVPYSALLLSLSQILQQILSETEEDVKAFCSNLSDCLGSQICNIGLLADLVPELRTLLLDSKSSSEKVEQTKAPCLKQGGGIASTDESRLDNVEARARFHNLYIEVFRAVTRWRMTTLFLDDLHQADDPSIELIGSLISAKIELLIFISYRDQEITSVLAETLSSHAGNVYSMEVGALGIFSVSEYLLDALHWPSNDDSRKNIKPLAEFLYKRTQGNIFYIIQLILVLIRKEHIYFSWEKNEWTFDLDNIKKSCDLEESSLRDSDLVEDVSFMMARLRELPEDGQRLLRWASLVGDTFSWTTIKNLMLHIDELEDDEQNSTRRKSIPSVSSARSPHTQSDLKFLSRSRAARYHRYPMRGLQAVLREGYIMPIGDNIFKWSHDRISQAAAEMVNPTARSKMHLIIAQYLMNEKTMDPFLVADHLLQCQDLLVQSEDSCKYRQILIDAGNKCQTAGAHKMAFACYMGAIDLNRPDCWEGDNYKPTLNLYTNAAALSWIIFQYDKTELLLGIIFERSRNPIDRLTAYRIKGTYFLARRMNDKSRDTLLECLEEVGDKAWRHFETTEEEVENAYHMTGRLIEEVGLVGITKREPCKNRMLQGIMQALEDLIIAYYWTGQQNEMYYWACRMFCMSMEQGITSPLATACVFIGFGYVQRYKKFQLGEQIGAVGVFLSDKYGSDRNRGRIYLLYATYLMQWRFHHREALPWFREGIQISLAGGDRLFSTYHQAHVVNGLFNFGYHLTDALEEAEAIYKDVKTYASYANSTIFAICVIRTIKALQGMTQISGPDVFDGPDGFTEEQFITESCNQNSNPEMSLSWYESFKMIPLTLYGHIDQAIKTGHRCLLSIECHPCHRHTRMMLAYFSLALVEKARQDPENRTTYLAQVQKNQVLLYEWAVPSAINYGMYWSFVEAEIASLEGISGIIAASGLYEQAIRQAREGGWKLELCVFHEYTGAYYERIGLGNIAYGFIKKAIDLYTDLGAYGKAHHLATKFEGLLSECNDRNSASRHVEVQTDPLPRERTDFRPSHSPPATPVAKADTSETIPPATTEQMLMTLDILDMASILKSSLVMSSEVNFNSLLNSMMSIIMENSGAERGAIIVKEEKYGICAYGLQDQNPLTYDPPQLLSENDSLVSSRIVHHTLHTRESIFIPDTDLDSRFAVGPWFERARKKSVICMPIIHKSAMAGCLFIEGRIGIFTPHLITVLSLLCQQMGISIANAVLFKSIQRVTSDNMKMIEMQKHALEDARKSKEAADRAIRLREIFLANMSHEIRTPFSGFYGMISLLADTDLNQEQHELVRIAKESCEMLLQIIDDLLNFSKLQAGKVFLDLSPVVVEDLIADVVEMLIAMAIQKNISITYMIEREVPAVIMADANRLRQIIINLLGNAIKFTHEGEIMIRCALDKSNIRDDNQISLMFEVEDTGIGITEEQRKVLFVPFSQVDGSTTRKYGGTGLGLSICLQLVELMSGHIDVRSNPGKGSNFYFSILTSPVAAENDRFGNKLLKNLESIGPLRILVADTCPSTVTMIQNMVPDNMTVEGLISRGDGYHYFHPADSIKRYDILVIGLFLARERKPETWSMLLNYARHTIVMHYPIRIGSNDNNSSVGLAAAAASSTATFQKLSSDRKISRMTVPFRRRKLLQLIHEKVVLSANEYDPPIRPLRRPYKALIAGNNKYGSTMAVKDPAITEKERLMYCEMNILAAEDNPVAQKLLWKQLTRIGFNVVCANNGQEAVEIWTRHPPGYFAMGFFDHHMPKCDGVEATKKIRALEEARKGKKDSTRSRSIAEEESRRFPILALTADIQDSAREICIRAGMDGYLTKPMNHRTLVEAVRRYCNPQ
ncbi:hypothetical protein BX666DRAFT_1965528 [Dichotomocladium elegans]|nr:hypothetical protein BX666DRAFT_1965528 [Dichotomocladium elegans]